MLNQLYFSCGSKTGLASEPPRSESGRQVGATGAVTKSPSFARTVIKTTVEGLVGRLVLRCVPALIVQGVLVKFRVEQTAALKIGASALPAIMLVFLIYYAWRFVRA